MSDQPSPIQDGFANPNSNTMLIQTRIGPSMILEVEAFHGLVNGKPWAVNNQSPIHGAHRLRQLEHREWQPVGSDRLAPAHPPR